MIEQELASIIKFVLEAAGNPTPYYWSVPEGFSTPSVFFPTPEIESAGETFRTYRLEYVWYLQFFHKDTNEAHSMALRVYEAIKKARNLVHLVDETGQLMRDGVRLGEPSLKNVDSGVAQLTIRFASRRPYYQPDSELMQQWTAIVTDKYDGVSTTDG
jgi:hypothetical protein